MSFDKNFTTLTLDERVAEAHRLLIIIDHETCDVDPDPLTEKERNFVQGMHACKYCSPSQLQWLRAIKDKVIA